MFSNTISLDIGEATITLNRVNQDNYGSEYILNNDTHSYVLKLRHSSEGKKNPLLPEMIRHNILFERTAYPTPTSLAKTDSFSMTVRHQKLSNPAEATDMVKGALGWLNAGTTAAYFIAGNN